MTPWSRLALLLALGAGHWIAPLAAQSAAAQAPRVGEAKMLADIQEDLVRKRGRKERDLPYSAQILMRPRGCSFDGRWAVFEKRRNTEHTEISLVLFDMARFVRTEFLLPSFEARQKAVRDPGVDGPAIPSNAMEHRFDQSVLGVDTEFESPTGSIYRFNLEKQIDRVNLKVWLTLLADRGGG